MDLTVHVKEIIGYCPVYSLDDSFELKEGYKLVSEKPVCMHSLASLMPYYNALRHTTPEALGLAGEADRSKAFVQCSDPCSYTGGGTVVFEIEKSE